MQTLFCFVLVMTLLATGMPASAQQHFYRTGDLHTHLGYKHINRPPTPAEHQEILTTTRYDRKTNVITFDSNTVRKFRDVNWSTNPAPGGRKKHWKQLRTGATSDLRNYDQASYAQIAFTPGSILCTSFYPFEKQYATTGFKIWVNSKFVSKMGMPRLKYYKSDAFTPFDDFMAEYFFILMQDSVKHIRATVPKELYLDKNSSGRSDLLKYISKIKLVHNNAELKAAVEHNDRIFARSITATDTIITPVLMSIEGSQVLYGPVSGQRFEILEPLVGKDVVHEEILNNALAIKNLPHRLFFICPGHFAENHTVGFAKTIDRDPENFQHRLPAMLSVIPWMRNTVLFKKKYDGINDTKQLGEKVFETLLDPSNTVHKKPTYIDVKHMDIRARVQYYYLRRQYEKKYDTVIPIIASHFGVAGESQAMAAATGLWPNFDRYRETENPREYYYRRVLREEDPDAREKFWLGVMSGKPYKRDPLLPEDMRLYKPLNFLHDWKGAAHFDPFENTEFKKDTNAGWYYNWSINLFDEEIIEIAKSDGIIGLLLDPRQLGAYAPKYSKDYLEKVGDEYDRLVKTIPDAELNTIGISRDELNRIEYLKTEALLRNIFHIVRLLTYQQDGEKNPDKYPSYVRDSIGIKKEPWNIISLGSDYDGLIDPVDYAPTAAHLPGLHKRIIVYAYIYSILHKREFHLPDTTTPLIPSMEQSRLRMQQIFYTNARNFMLTYF